MKQALEALDLSHPRFGIGTAKHISATAALRQAIEQAEKQEPVAVIRTWHKMGEQHAELWNWHTGLDALPDGKHTLYTTPKPKREWVGLTEEDKQIAFDDTQEGGGFWEFADAIEAKLKEKNTCLMF